VSNTKLVSLCK